MLSDGRRYKKVGNMWQEMSSGMRLNENTMQFMVSSAAFGGDASSGGGSKKISLLDIGVYGSYTISDWLRAAYAGTDSIDFVLIGDSNVGFGPTDPAEAIDNELSGYTDGLISAGISMGFTYYGTPIYYPAINSSNAIGYKSGMGSGVGVGTGNTLSGHIYGPASLSSGFSGGTFFAILDTQSPTPDNRGLYPFAGNPDYLWRKFAQTWDGNSSEYMVILGNDHPFYDYVSVGNPLYYRLLLATSTVGGVGGTFGVTVRRNASGGTTTVGYPNIRVNTSTVVGSGVTFGTFTPPNDYLNWQGVNIGYTLGWAAGVTMNFSFTASGNGSANLYPIGNIGIGLQSSFIKRKGISSHPLNYRGSANMSIISDDIGGTTSVGTSGAVKSLRTYLREVVSRQAFAKTGIDATDGRVCIFIQGGMNIETGDVATSTATYLSKFKTLITNIQNEWNDMVDDAELGATVIQGNLQFIVFTSHQSVNPDDEYKAAYRTSLRNNLITDLSAVGLTNVTLIDILRNGGDFAGLTASGYYDNAGTAHLDGFGYRDVSAAILTSLLARTSTTHV